MAANSYYSHLPSDVDLSAPQSKQSSPLKPMFLAGNHMVAQHDAQSELAYVRGKDDVISRLLPQQRITANKAVYSN
jgi:hypothetical protein